MGETGKGASKEDDTLILLDVLVARPASIGATAAGIALFVAWSPFSIPFGTVKDSWNKFVTKPMNYAFKRPLGEL
jgi:hypothetical protein